MAVTLYTGPPGSGKSYALVSQVIVNAMLQGRRILTNIDGLKPDLVREYCKEQNPAADLGEIILFHGNDSHDPMFWPHEGLSPDQTFVKAGDLIVFDEWKLYYAESGKLQSDTVVPFIRWHRHFTDEHGRSCDLIIATQVAADIHRQIRGVVEKSFDFFKLSMVGLSKAYRWKLYEGRLQNKNTFVRDGQGTYKKEIFPLYKTSDAEGTAHTELANDKRATMFSKWFIAGGVACLVMAIVGAWGVWDFFTDGAELQAAQADQEQTPGRPQALQPSASSTPSWRIAGHLVALEGPRVVMQGRNGEVRYVAPDNFVFDGDRPVLGTFEGLPVTADEWVIREEESPINEQFTPPI